MNRINNNDNNQQRSPSSIREHQIIPKNSASTGKLY